MLGIRARRKVAEWNLVDSDPAQAQKQVGDNDFSPKNLKISIVMLFL